MPQAFILPSFLIGFLAALGSPFSKRRSTEIDAVDANGCDPARCTIKVRSTNAAASIDGAVGRKIGAADVPFDSRTSHHAVASTQAVASTSAMRPRHWRATNSAPFPRTLRAEPEADRGSSPAAAERPVTSVGADLGAWLGLTIGGTVRAGGAS